MTRRRRIFMKQKIIETKLEFSWYFISVYLEMLSKIGATYKDEGFATRLNDLQNYVDEKLPLSGNGDIIDYFVTILQKS